MMDHDNSTWDCDRCGKEIPMDDSYPGPADTEWEPYGLCEECHLEVTEEQE
jgi:RNA polymerase-binding transcription factor DksA